MKRKLFSASFMRIISRGIILAAVLFLGIFVASGEEGIPKPITLTIVHTNNVNGHLFPCPT